MAKKKVSISPEALDDGKPKPVPLTALVRNPQIQHLLNSSDSSYLIPYRGAMECDSEEVGNILHQEEVQNQNARRVVALQKAQLILARLQIEDLRQVSEQRATMQELQLKLLRLQIAELEKKDSPESRKVCKPSDDFLSSD